MMFFLRRFRALQHHAKCNQVKIGGSLSSLLRLVHSQSKEIRIPVPWGHIAGRHWNENTSAIPIICLHGWKDNAGSYDRVLPLILEQTNEYQFICIDLPGHGLSSHYPPGMLYQWVDFMVVIRRVFRHFGWPEKGGIRLVGHSLGAILSFIFAASHPSLVDSVIAIDGLVPIIHSRTDVIYMVNFTSENVMNLEAERVKKKLGRAYDKNELFEKMLTSHMCGLDPVACEFLSKRTIIESPGNPGKYIFSHDPRVQFLPLMGFSAGQIRHLARAFESKLLHIKAEDGVNYISDYMQNNLKRWLQKDNKKLIKFVTIKKASHHVHLSEPEKVAPLILQFLAAAR